MNNRANSEEEMYIVIIALADSVAIAANVVSATQFFAVTHKQRFFLLCFLNKLNCTIEAV
jgi:hypothetical protein